MQFKETSKVEYRYTYAHKKEPQKVLTSSWTDIPPEKFEFLNRSFSAEIEIKRAESRAYFINTKDAEFNGIKLNG